MSARRVERCGEAGPCCPFAAGASREPQRGPDRDRSDKVDPVNRTAQDRLAEEQQTRARGGPPGYDAREHVDRPRKQVDMAEPRCSSGNRCEPSRIPQVHRRGDHQHDEERARAAQRAPRQMSAAVSILRDDAGSSCSASHADRIRPREVVQHPARHHGVHCDKPSDGTLQDGSAVRLEYPLVAFPDSRLGTSSSSTSSDRSNAERTNVQTRRTCAGRRRYKHSRIATTDAKPNAPAAMVLSPRAAINGAAVSRLRDRLDAMIGG